MQRPDAYSALAWDDPFWQVVRMVVDESRGAVLSAAAIQDKLAGGGEAQQALRSHLASRPEMLDDVAVYTQFRHQAGADLFALMRTEDEALSHFKTLSDDVVRRYGTQSADHHQSPKVVVATVEVLTRDICLRNGLEVDVDPQKRIVHISDDRLWVSPRRLDGALPGLFNPVGIWEIKEYWGGSKSASEN